MKKSLCVAIHQDDYSGSAEKCDAASPRWADLLKQAGHRVKWVDVRRPDILEQLAGCQGFMWRWAHFKGMGRIARRLLPVIERELGVAVYPDQNTCWHYDDKGAQAYLLRAASIPIPQTWLWFDAQAAREWAKATTYPVVLKLAGGAGSTNVRLIQTAGEAHAWIDRLFNQRLSSLEEDQFKPLPWKERLSAAWNILQSGSRPTILDDGFEPQSGYVLFQEFLPGNTFDTRVTVIGNRAFAFRRLNRDNDFRASGSGRIDWKPEVIDPKFVLLAFSTARRLKTQSCAIDGLYRGKECVVGEISYTYATWAVQTCPGHWNLDGTPAAGALQWIPGKMWPEEAQIEDFLLRLNEGPKNG